MMKKITVSTQTLAAVRRFGIEGGVDMLMDAGYTGLDFSFFEFEDLTFFRGEGATALAEGLRKKANDRGVIFNQAHAPFGGGYANYVNNLVPHFPEVFEFSAALGVKNIVVHPLQNGRYYGRERELFDLNMDFYRSLIPLSEHTGVKIAIENMWQRHPVNGNIVDDVCADPHELAMYYDTLDDPRHFTVCLDIGHVALCGREPQDAIRIIGHDCLGALHVHDVDYVSDLHTLPGCARIDFYEVMRALGEIDYKGDLTLEADSFLARFDDAHVPTAAKFMCDTAKHFAAVIDEHRPKA